MYESRQYLIFPVSKVDFSLVCETSADTLRKSVDGATEWSAPIEDV